MNFCFRGPERTTPSPPSYQSTIQNASFPFSIPRAINFVGRHGNQMGRVFQSKASNSSHAGNFRQSNDSSSVTSGNARADTNTMSKYYNNDGNRENERENLDPLSREQNSMSSVGHSDNFGLTDSASENFPNGLSEVDIKPNPCQLAESWLNNGHKSGDYQENSVEPQSKRLRISMENDQRPGQDYANSPSSAHAQSPEQLTCALNGTGYGLSETDLGMNRCKTEDTNW